MGGKVPLKVTKVRVRNDMEDKLIWAGEKNGNFSIKALYKVLELRGTSIFPTSII